MTATSHAVFSGGLLRLSGERSKKTKSERDREPDPPHQHLDGGRLAGSLADLNLAIIDDQSESRRGNRQVRTSLSVDPFNPSQTLIVDFVSRVPCFLLILVAAPVAAQDVVGRRLFSDQLVISEPFVEDELSLPSILHIRRPATSGEAGALVTQFGAELKKRLTSNLEGSVSGGLTLLQGDGETSRAGFDNLQLGLKY